MIVNVNLFQVITMVNCVRYTMVQFIPLPHKQTAPKPPHSVVNHLLSCAAISSTTKSPVTYVAKRTDHAATMNKGFVQA